METKVFLQTLRSEPIVKFYDAPEDLDVEEIRQSLVEYYPPLANASFTETFEDDGSTRVILFTEVYGDKGKA